MLFITILGLFANCHGLEGLIKDLRTIFHDILALPLTEINVYAPVELSRNFPGNKYVVVRIKTTTSAHYNKLVADETAVSVFNRSMSVWAEGLRTAIGLKISVKVVIEGPSSCSFIF